jgi:protoporphyrinogen oxidase
LNENVSPTVEKSDSENEAFPSTHLQVEVYESESRLNGFATSEVVEKVIKELREIGLIQETASVTATAHTTEWANVIFDLQRKPALEEIYSFLERFGLPRNSSEFSANYPSNEPLTHGDHNELYLLGRFGQWNYYWTHDCVKKAREVSSIIRDVEMG